MKFRGAFFWHLISIRKVHIVILLFGVILISITWLFLFFKVQSEQQMEIDHSMKMVTGFARAFQEHSLRTLKSADQVALFIKYQYEIEGRVFDISTYLREAGLTEPYVLVSIANGDGDLIASNQESFMSSSIRDRDHFKVHKAVDTGKSFISKPVFGRSSGKYSIQMTRRINKPDGLFGGVVIVSIDPFYFTDFYNQVNLGRDSAIGLVGYDGIVRAWQSNQQSSIGQDLSNSQLMKELAQKDSGQYSATSPVDGVKRVYSYQSLPDYHLAITVGLSESEVLADFNQRRKVYCIAAFLLSLFIVGFCFMLIKMKWLKQEFVRLERLNLIGEMAAGIGHEIRNPMTTVRGFLQLLGSKPKYSNDKEYFDLMIEELDRANSIITEYLTLSKDRVVESTFINLNEIITRLLPLIKAEAIMQDKDVKISTEKIPELLLDEKQIRQLILNLVRNGLEAMSPGGKLIIRTFIDNSEIVMAIQDEGKGIEPHLIDKIGTPFFTTKDSGTGLGLAVCYSVASRHNASIKLETTPAGTTFFIRFKAAKNQRIDTSSL